MPWQPPRATMPPMSAVPDRPPPRQLLASLAVAAGGLLLLLLLPQRILHGVDSNQFAVWIEEGALDRYPRHLAYLHFCGAVHWLLGPWQVAGLVALRIAAAIGTAIGLFASHRALLLLPRGNLPHAAAGAAAILLLPAWFFYGSCAETSGVFAAGVGLCWWSYARWQARSTLARAAALGLAGAVAGALHAFGHLLTPGLLLIGWLHGARSHWRALLPAAATAVLAHGGLAVLLPLLLAGSSSGQASDAVGHLQERWTTLELATAPAVLWREWILPYGPWSLLAVAALLRPQSRRWALATLWLLALHLPLAVLLLGHHQIEEQGAYLMALGLPALLASMHLLPRTAFWPALAVSMALTVRLAAPGWQDPVPPGFAAGIAALQRQQPVAFVLAGPDELDAARSATAGLMALNLVEVMDAHRKTVAAGQDFGSWFDRHAEPFLQMGLPIVFSERSRRFFADSEFAELRRFWQEHLPAQYEVTAVQQQGFRGTRLRRR
jgi:hypothetical protein